MTNGIFDKKTVKEAANQNYSVKSYKVLESKLRVPGGRRGIIESFFIRLPFTVFFPKINEFPQYGAVTVRL